MTTYTYNANNQMTSEVRPSATGATGAGPTTRVYYDALGRQVAQRDANGNVNGSVYDAAGDLIEELHADGGVVRYDYNGFGDKVTWLDAMGNRTGYTYDNMDRLLTTSHAVVTSYTVNGAFQTVATGTSSLVERDTYDQMGHRLTTTDGAGATTYYRYDMRGNVVGVQQPGIGVEVRSAYDAQGNKIFESDANSNGATWTYDYFGHLIGHKDVGGAQYYYTYNSAWELVDEANTRGQHFTYSYDAAGQVTQIVDQALGQVTEYQYDNAGNKIREKTTQGGVVYQDNYLGYDALGLLRDVTDGGHVHESIDYDADGNRVHVQTTYLDSASNMQGKNLWYGYDSMNRQTTVDAADASLNINAAQGHKLTFDYNGNRTSDTYWDKTISVYGASAGFTTETYTYDGMNRLVSTSRDGLELDHRYYDAASRVVQSGITGNFAADFYSLTGLDNTYQQNQYDGAGRLYDQRVTMLKDSGWAEKSNTTYTSYDNAGNVLQYVVENFDQQHYVNTYTYTMQRFEGYVQASLSGTSNVYDPGTTTYGYDVNGDLISVVDQKDSSNNQTLVNDINGKILQRTQNGTTIRSLIVNGELMGSIGPEAGVGDFTPTYRPIDGTNPKPAPGLYTVQAGDTLQSIAQTAYGDSKLWHLVADANGLSSDRDLRVGQSVNIPNRVSGNSNDYKAFKPYDPGKIIGDTTPTMPVPEPESSGGGGGCGIIGTVIVAVIAVVATVFTAGALAAPAGAALGTIMSTGASVLVGAGSLAGVGTLASLGAAVAGAAVGSIVSQGAAMALGMQNKFSWSAVGTSALTEAATFGVGAGISAAAGSSNTTIANAAKAMQVGSSDTVGTVARVALANSASQGVAMAVGAQSKFSWTNVAASAAGAAVANNVHVNLGSSSQYANKFTSTFVSSAAGGVASAVLSGGKANYVQVAVDAFGNALANSIAESSSGIPMGDAKGSLDDLTPADGNSNASISVNQPVMLRGIGSGADSGVSTGNGIGLRVSNSDVENFGPQTLRYATESTSNTSLSMDPSGVELPTQFVNLVNPKSLAIVAGDSRAAISTAWNDAKLAQAQGQAGADFATGLSTSSDDRSVMDPKPSISKRLGYDVRDGIVNLGQGIKEFALEAADIARIGSHVMSGSAFMPDGSIFTPDGSAPGFNPEPLEPWSKAGQAAQQGASYFDVAPNPVGAIAGIGVDFYFHDGDSVVREGTTLVAGFGVGSVLGRAGLPVLNGIGNVTDRALGAFKSYFGDGVDLAGGLGDVIGNYSAIDPGPLGAKYAETFAGGRYTTIVLKEDTIFYRAGTASNPLGEYFSLESPTSVVQTRMDKAILPQWPNGAKSPIDTSFAIKIPAGTEVHVGQVGTQGGFYVGGTKQIVIPKPWTINGVQVIHSRPIK